MTAVHRLRVGSQVIGLDHWAGDALRLAKGCAGFLISSERRVAERRQLGHTGTLSLNLKQRRTARYSDT